MVLLLTTVSFTSLKCQRQQAKETHCTSHHPHPCKQVSQPTDARLISPLHMLHHSFLSTTSSHIFPSLQLITCQLYHVL